MGCSTAPVSVVVPCLNSEGTLGEALDSVFAQTAPPLEVLVIDDRSTDRSVAIARSFGPQVRVLRNPQSGPNAARRAGVTHARGTYVAFCDSDDLLEPAKHERQLAVLDSPDPYTLVHTGSVVFWPDGSRPDLIRSGGERASGRCTQAIFEGNPVCGASTMFRRAVILELGNYDPEMLCSGDYALWLIASTRCDFVYLPEPLYRMRRHANNVTNHKSNMAYFHWLAQEKFRQRCPEAFARLPPESVREYMVEPVLRAVREAYWRRDPGGYARLLRLAISLAPGDPEIRQLWRRRRVPMRALRGWDRVTRRAASLKRPGADGSTRPPAAGEPQATPRPHLALVVWHPGGIGGMERFTRFLVGTVLAAGWRVTIALSGENVYQGLAPNGGCRPVIEQVDWAGDPLKGDWRYRLRTIVDRWRWFRRVRPDAALFVQSSNTPHRASIVGARLAGVPIAVTQRTMPWIRDFVPSRRHLFGLLPGLGLHNRRQIRRVRLTAALADRIIYNSQRVRCEYERQYGYPRDKAHVIVNAVEVPAAAMNSCDSDNFDPGGAITIGHVGRLAPEKRIDVLLRAMAALPAGRAVRVLVYGEGPERSALEALARQLGISDRVEWCGVTDDVWSAYQRLEIVALCSRRESSSNTVLEAMAAGKAVVVTDVGGLPELTGHGRWGVCVPAGDVPALTAALTRLVEDGQERIAFGSRARQAARAGHDPTVVGRAWLNLLAEVAGSRSGRCARRRDDQSGEPTAISSGQFDAAPAGQY